VGVALLESDFLRNWGHPAEGGMIWGISAALHEQTDIDMRAARYTNKDLAEYLISK
jgi:hypothetical protein